MSAKKKTPAELKKANNKRFLAKKKVKKVDAAVEAAIAPDPFAVPQAPLPPEVSSIDTFNSEDFNEFAPNQGMSGIAKLDALIAAALDELGDPAPAEAPPEPVYALPRSRGQSVPETLPASLEGPSDAIVVERLINAINYLYPIARLQKGPRGPQPKDVEKIISNIKLARELVERLK